MDLACIEATAAQPSIGKKVCVCVVCGVCMGGRWLLNNRIFNFCKFFCLPLNFTFLIRYYNCLNSSLTYKPHYVKHSVPPKYRE